MPEKTAIAPIKKTPQTRRLQKRAWATATALIFVCLMVAGCIHVPEENNLISYRFSLESVDETGAATAGRGRDNNPAADLWKNGSDASSVPDGLNPEAFTFVNWNVFKGKKDGWEKDVEAFIRSSDILTLQEAYLTDELKKMLYQGNLNWDMSEAFQYRKIATGVLTAARVSPSFLLMFRDKEPIIRFPKSVLVSKYPLSGTAEELAVANIHGINFSIGQKAFKKQLDRMEAILSGHRGPMIVSGDFNTWSAGRLSQLRKSTSRLGLSAVRFEKNHRSRFFGYDIDHIFYRGLKAKEAKTPIVSTSDHNPLTVTFTLDTTTDENN